MRDRANPGDFHLTASGDAWFYLRSDNVCKWLTQKLIEVIGAVLFVIPAEAGIQKSQIPWIPARASYRQLGRNDRRKSSATFRETTLKQNENKFIYRRIPPAKKQPARNPKSH
jgi:hypothetical protein